jgi:hypothetical protein
MEFKMAKIVLKRAPVSTNLIDIVTKLRHIRNASGANYRIDIPARLRPLWTSHPNISSSNSSRDIYKFQADGNNNNLVVGLSTYFSHRYKFESQLSADLTRGSVSTVFNPSSRAYDLGITINTMNHDQAVKFAKILSRYMYLINKTLITKKVPYIFNFEMKADEFVKQPAVSDHKSKMTIQLYIKAHYVVIVHPVTSKITSITTPVEIKKLVNEDTYRLDEDRFISMFKAVLKRNYIKFIQDFEINPKAVKIHAAEVLTPNFHHIDTFTGTSSYINSVQVELLGNTPFSSYVNSNNSVNALNELVVKLHSADPTALTEEDIAKLVESSFKFIWHSSKITLYSQILANMIDNIMRRVFNGSLRSSFVA